MLPPQQFAVEVVRQLRDAGYQALFAGGCVRDQLLGTEPQDYDVATDATPEQVIAAFPNRKTLAIGAAFGVIAVVGPRYKNKPSAGVVEVATFRRDLAYSDGRRPDGVEFCSPEEDAERRDFTINGMFYDPLAERVLDYVGGQSDLQRGVIRAIGEPRARFTEDKLRLLRAVRFTARLGFALEDQTKAAIQELAAQLGSVSVERISDELRKLLVVPRRAGGVRLLRETNLLPVIFSEWETVLALPGEGQAAWEAVLAELAGLEQPTFPLALAVLLAPLPALLPKTEHDKAAKSARFARDPATRCVQQIGRRLKLSNDEIDATAWLVRQQDALLTSAAKPWSVVQPLLIMPWAGALLQWSEVRAHIRGESPASLDWCRERLAWPPEQLDPPPLLTGDDLIHNGIKPGPHFTGLLAELRAKQLDQELKTPAAAWEWIKNSSPTR